MDASALKFGAQSLDAAIDMFCNGLFGNPQRGRDFAVGFGLKFAADHDLTLTSWKRVEGLSQDGGLFAGGSMGKGVGPIINDVLARQIS